MKILLSRVMILCGLSAAVNSVFAQTWKPTSSPIEYWISLASSADSSKLVAQGFQHFLVSTNGGITWLTNNQPGFGSLAVLNSMALSADGTKIVGVAGTTCWGSTNLGKTWSSNNVPGATALNCVAMSADGSKLVAASGQPGGQSVPGPICISTNSGMTWTQTMAPTNTWASVASSADGNKLVAAVHTTPSSSNGNFIYISTNSGTSWILSDAPTNIPWWSVASSADGSKVVAASSFVNTDHVTYGSVYTSTDFGMTWQSNSIPAANWVSAASSEDGTKLVAGGSPVGFIYNSTNSGASWVSNSAPDMLGQSKFVSSADGNIVFAMPIVSTTNVFIYQTTPTPQISISSSASNLELSWLIPSTNFVVQESPDLISWSSITNVPALNLTNLNNELSLSPTNGSGFFRLMSQ